MTDLNLEDFFFEQSLLTEEISKLDLSCLSKGKNLRSKLVYQFGTFLNINSDDLLKLGRVVEMVHNATLTHDDVIDNSHTRRESPSVPTLVNNKKSVLLGDYMLARSLFELGEFNHPRLLQELTITLKDLVEGEWMQYEHTNPYTTSLNIYETLSIKKTGSLFRWCFVAPALLGAQEKHYELLSEFGEKLGLIFQMTDDLIDFNEESKKTYGLDFKNNNLNFVLYFVGKKHPELTQELLQADSLESLSAENLSIIKEAVSDVKEELKKHTSRLFELLALLDQGLFQGNEIKEDLESLIELINSRTY